MNIKEEFDRLNKLGEFGFLLHETSIMSNAIDSFTLGYKSRDREIKKLREALKKIAERSYSSLDRIWFIATEALKDGE